MDHDSYNYDLKQYFFVIPDIFLTATERVLETKDMFISLDYFIVSQNLD